MTSREKEILQIIKNNPMIQQQEIAERLKINRSSVAVHIANLMKKGYIKGKGYVVQEEKKVTVLGGSNIDLQGFPNEKLFLQDSNPGRIETSLGGVGRNIAENLARLLIPVQLLTAVGEDLYGKRLIEEARGLGIDIDNVLISHGYPTSMYLSIMDEDHDMKVAISQMDIYKEINQTFIEERHLLIKNGSLLAIDTNIHKETFDYVCETFKELPIFCDPVSTAKVVRVQDALNRIHTIKPNIYEAGKLANIEIKTINDVRKAGEQLLKKGVKRAFISMGEKGVFACDAKEELIVKSVPSEIKGATGAGDAFMAGIITSYLQEMDLKETAIYGTAAALMALASSSTINPLISQVKIMELIKKENIEVEMLV